jgi:putative ABC transport system permease protein
VDIIAGRSTLTILSDGAGIPEETLQRISWLRRTGVAIAPAVSDMAAFAGPDGEVVEVFGIDAMADGSVRDYALEASGGRTPSGRGAAEGLSTLFAIFEKDSLLLTSVLAARLGVKAGDAVTLVAQGQERKFRVAALVRPSGPARAAAGAIVFADIATVQEAFGKVGRLDRIDIVLPKETSIEEIARLAEEVNASLPEGIHAGRPERRTETVDRMVRAFRVNLTALGLIALLVGVYFVYNTLSISVLRRRADIGTFRALGASRTQVFLTFLAEGAFLGTAGGTLGVLLGIVLARVTLAMVGGTVTDFYSPATRAELAVDPEILAFAFLTGLVASILSSLAPALEAASVPPAAAMRHGSVEASRRRAVLPLSAGGAVCLILAWLATLPGPVNGLPVYGFASVFLAVAGASLLAPLLVVAAAALLEMIGARYFGAVARIGRANLTGSLSRTSVAVAALTMGIGMMVSVAVMVGSFRDTVIIWIDQTLKADLFITAAAGRSNVSFGRLPQEFLDSLSRLPVVADWDGFLGFSATKDGVPYTIGSGRLDFVASRGNLPLVVGGDPREVAGRVREKREALVSEPYAVKFGVRVGDEVEVPAKSGPTRLRVAGVYLDYSNDRGTILLDRDHFRELFGLDGAVSVAVVLRQGIAPEEGIQEVRRAFGDRFALRIRTNSTLRRDALRLFDRTFAVTYALELVAIAVAVLGVFNTLLALVLERRREIALLRVLGASAKKVKRAIGFEAAAIGALGIGMGCATGAVMSYVLIHVINKQSFGWTIQTHVPWLFLGSAALLVFVTTLLASWHPARLASGVAPAEALREE